jgi:hypothetical protein
MTFLLVMEAEVVPELYIFIVCWKWLMIQEDPVTMSDDLYSRKWHVWFGIHVRPVHLNVKSGSIYICMCWLYTPYLCMCAFSWLSVTVVMQCFELY